MATKSESNPLGGIGSLGSQESFPNHIDGIYGTFSTPAGTVCYLQTKARLGADGSKHAQLTKALVPAREALNVEEMDFNQLLQRDLDDHRIATKLIPYILNPPPNSLPGFFPPIVAVLLPFNHQQQPLETFAPPTDTFDEDQHYGGSRFRMVTHMGAYRVQYIVGQDDQPLSVPIAVLRWNPETAKLVIMDGQHRAMSLLAIERTVNKSWHTATKGARYQPFYEEHVGKWLSQAKQEGRNIDLSKVELPVTICWFPESVGQNPRPRPHMAARKLFVDVNNTAKPPSEARLVLLSDTRLDNIFARELLNRLRRDEQWKTSFPLYGVEYDNPNASLTTPRRWSVVTNLEILKDAVIRTVFGPPKLVENMGASLQGKPPLSAMDRHMRIQLKVDDLFQMEFHDGPRPLIRENLGNETFPLNDSNLHQKLLDAFYNEWGKGLLFLLCQVEPYKAHLQALRERYSTWTAADNIQTLAKDALFEGVGMFWTIEDGHLLWVNQKQEARDYKRPEPPQPDISKAWVILDGEQKKEFKKHRAKVYIGSDDDTDTEDCDQLYRGLITYAAQVGLALAWASIHKIAAPDCNPFDLAQKIAEAINHSLASGPTAQRNRKLILSKASKKDGFKPLNTLPRLEPSYAIHFRYFWLELMLFQENHRELASCGVDLVKAVQLLDSARKVYLKMLIDERRKLRLRDSSIVALTTTKEQAEKATELAINEVLEEQAQAHRYWFGGTISDRREQIKNSLLLCEVVESADVEESFETDDEVTPFGTEDEKI